MELYEPLLNIYVYRRKFWETIQHIVCFGLFVVFTDKNNNIALKSFVSFSEQSVLWRFGWMNLLGGSWVVPRVWLRTPLSLSQDK